MQVSDIEMAKSAGDRNYVVEEIKKWAPDLRLSARDYLDKLLRYDLNNLLESEVVKKFIGYKNLFFSRFVSFKRCRSGAIERLHKKE